MVKRKPTPSRTSQRPSTSKRSKHDSTSGSPDNSIQDQDTSRRKQKAPKKKNAREKTNITIASGKQFQPFKTTIREIKRLQSQTKLLIPKLPFSRLIREILMEVSCTSRMIQVEALRALQEAAEVYLTYLLQDANKCAMHARRITLMPNDVKLVLELRNYL